MSSNLQRAETDATVAARSVQNDADKFRIESSTKLFASFATVLDALSYPARDLPSGSIVVDAVGRVRATLERHWNSAGTRQSPVWVLCT